jgi:alpha-beta hydrolase superfamily lysophospholipase
MDPYAHVPGMVDLSTMGERVTFKSSTGPNLAGVIDVPDRAVRGWGVFAHGFTLGKDSPAAARICKQLAADGIGMLRFDALGLGGSEGDWGDGSFTVKVDDIVKACEFMADRATPADILVGHSWGGACSRRRSTRQACARLSPWRRRLTRATSRSITTQWSIACCPKAVPSGWSVGAR